MTNRTPLRKCCETCPGDETCPHAAVCMCGNAADHSPWDGHPPVSMHDYYCEQISVGETQIKDEGK